MRFEKTLEKVLPFYKTHRIGIFFMMLFDNVDISIETIAHLLQLKQPNGKKYTRPAQQLINKCVREDAQWNKKRNEFNGKCEIEHWLTTFRISPTTYEKSTGYEYPTNLPLL